MYNPSGATSSGTSSMGILTQPCIWVTQTGCNSIPTPVFVGSMPTNATTIPVQSYVNQQMQQWVEPAVRTVEVIPQHIKLQLGRHRTISFPDGTLIDFYEDGRFTINDANAKVTYKANRVHDFNPFINASDKLEEFIRYCGDVGVRQGDMLGIPIKHFVQWLVIEAARKDGEDTSEVVALPNYSQPRCRTCRRFMSQVLKADGIEFCRPRCLEVRLNKTHRSEQHGKSRKANYKDSPKAGSESRAETCAESAASKARTALST